MVLKHGKSITTSQGGFMAKESFKKEQEMLRYLFLDGGAYSRSQFAAKLGISVGNFDKTLRNLKEALEHSNASLITERNSNIFTHLRYEYFNCFTNGLHALYKMKAVKKNEKTRLVFILRILADKSLSVKDILESLANAEDYIDEKNLRKYLDYLLMSDVINKVGNHRPYLYSLNREFFDNFSETELIEINDFIDFYSNTGILSAHGHLLKNSIRGYLSNRYSHMDLDAFLYKYNYFGRILDDFLCYELLNFITNRKKIRIQYHPRTSNTRYHAENTNPKFQKPVKAIEQVIIPLSIIYDHQYGRWYLIAISETNSTVSKYRLENIQSVFDTGEIIDKHTFCSHSKKLNAFHNSWVMDIEPTTRVIIKFFFDKTNSNFNFLKDRVSLQGQWGRITEETPDCFTFEISVNGTREIKPWIRSFGSSAEVIEPLSLRKEMIQEWQEIGGIYGSV